MRSSSIRPSPSAPYRSRQAHSKQFTCSVRMRSAQSLDDRSQDKGRTLVLIFDTTFHALFWLKYARLKDKSSLVMMLADTGKFTFVRGA